MKERIRLAVVDDHALLARERVVEVVGEADNGCDAIRVVGQCLPDLVLVDITIPGTKGRATIAEFVCLSVKTVEKHRSNLMSKLDIHNASSLTGFAIEQGLLPRYSALQRNQPAG